MTATQERASITENPPSKKAKVQASLLSHFSKTTTPSSPTKTIDASKQEPSSPARAMVTRPSSKLTPEQRSLCELEMRSLPPDWLHMLEPEFGKPYFAKLKQFLTAERAAGMAIFPPEDLIYSWAKLCPFDKTRVIIIGQDPYHNDGQAMGLAFSVPKGIAIPPSLVNIYLELSSDLKGTFTSPSHGCLEGWARQGVLLLNTSLTVRAHEPASHAGRGWEQFTDTVIRILSERRKNLVFLLWGNHAQKKGVHIDRKGHLILTSVHPSPLSASRGFFGCRHFSKCNDYLKEHGYAPIEWQQL